MSAAAYVGAVIGTAEAEAVIDLAGEGLAAARVALGWLRQRSAHHGTLPGTTVAVELQQAPRGWGGAVTLSDGFKYEFQDCDEIGTAALVATVVGALGGHEITDATARRLGQTLDVIMSECRRGEVSRPVEMRSAPTPVAPQTPREAARKLQVAPRKARGIMVTQDAAEAACGVCGGAQAIGKRLHGCLCWRELLSSARVARLHSGWLVTPGPDWGSDGAAAFAEACRG